MNPHFKLGAARLARTGLILGLLALPSAQAHQASDAFVNWRIDGAVVHERLDIALSDIDRVQALDDDGDGQLTWGEVQRHWGEIAALADAGLSWRADGANCRPAPRAQPALSRHGDGTHAVLERRFDCDAPVRRLQIDYRLFADSDASHRGLARVMVGAQPMAAGAETTAATAAGGPATPTEASEATEVVAASLVLVPGGPTQTVDLSAAAGDPHPPGAGQWQRFVGFVAEGMHHIAIGLDHLLFLTTLLMVAVWRREGRGWTPRETPRAAWGEALRLVTAFTAAHSITLALAASGVLAPPSRWVESAIAISVLVAALDNLRPFLPGPRWRVVALFGLVHGFGFAGPLQDLGLQRGNLALPLLGFNLGVELGQLLLVAVLLPLAVWLRSARSYRLALVPGGSAAVAMLALVWTLERGLGWSVMP